jgi:hypothetical protein
VLEGMDDVMKGRTVGHGDFRGELGDGVAASYSASLKVPDALASVGFSGGSNVPVVQAM